MALRGNLKDFSLPDVFQLVTFSRKSGVLRIKRADGAEGSVWFREGDVFFAQSNWHAELLGERLVRAQRITPQALDRALTLRAAEGERGRRLGQILIDDGYITDKVLEVFVSEQIQETIFDLMRWDEGDFDFEATPEIADEDIGLAVSLENVVMEGSRRLEEWTRIRKKIPSMDVVFKMATAPGEGTFEISLKPMEWNLLLLVDGTRSVAELAYATSRTDFEVARIIYGLFSAGLLEFATDAEIEKLRAERVKRESQLERIEAERAAAAAAETAAAQEREAALEAKAEQRAQAASAVATPVESRPAASVPAEVPEFLSGPVAPNAEDAAVLAEMMGAVLQPAVSIPAPPRENQPAQAPAPPVAEETEPATAPEPIAEPESLVPAIEPEPEPEPELELEPDFTDVLPLIPVAPVAEAAASVVPLPPSADIETVSEADALAEIQASLAVLGEPEQAVEAPSAEEFASSLMALGLGELPAEIAEPVTELAEPEPELVSEPEPVAELAEPEPEPVAELEEPEELSVEPADFSEPVAEIVVPAREPAGVRPTPSVASWASETAEPLGVAPTVSGEDFTLVPGASLVDLEAAEEETPDFSDLLGSLDYEAATQPEASYQAMPESSFDFDEELLREVAPPAETGGVISTDAFLEDIQTGEMDFSGGLTAELSALTGAGGRAGRPTASVNKLPEPGATGDMLHRDTSVGKDTLLKIIDGIKNL